MNKTILILARKDCFIVIVANKIRLKTGWARTISSRLFRHNQSTRVKLIR